MVSQILEMRSRLQLGLTRRSRPEEAFRNGQDAAPQRCPKRTHDHRQQNVAFVQL